MSLTIPPLKFLYSYAEIFKPYVVSCLPSNSSAPDWLAYNQTLADQLGLNSTFFKSDEGLKLFAGNTVLEGMQPYAYAYAGHQFGHFNATLGDGRAILLGEFIDVQGHRKDLQLKGAGRTAYSRGGDGRAAMGPVLREFLISEFMAAVGIATTRSLAAVSTGQSVWREHALPGAILVRVAASHIRFGTFEYFLAKNDLKSLSQLVDYVIDRHYPDIQKDDDRCFNLLASLISRYAKLIADWMLVGFVHGVMNTDNMAISGETLDYGPCAFMDHYQPNISFSSIDQWGRYAYQQQPQIALWNLTRLAECLLSVTPNSSQSVAKMETLLNSFNQAFEQKWIKGLGRKLGLESIASNEIGVLAQDLLNLMASAKADFTSVFRLLSVSELAGQESIFCEQFKGRESQAAHWMKGWRQSLPQDPQAKKDTLSALHKINPVFIPRNHWVEKALSLAQHQKDLSLFDELHQLTISPFKDAPGKERYTINPEPASAPYRTYCGT